MMTTLVGWHSVHSVPHGVREVRGFHGDELNTSSTHRYYIQRSASGWWWYIWDAIPTVSVRCRELDPARADDARLIAAWRRWLPSR